MNVSYFYKKYNLDERTINHCRNVGSVCAIITEMLDLKINKVLLKRAGLLHDLGACVYPKGMKGLTDFELVWGHQVKTMNLLKKEGYSLLAETASRHNIHGLTVEESKKWGYNKGVSLTPKSVESKILAFADSLRERYVNNGDCVTISNPKYRFLMKKYGMLELAEQRKRKLLAYLIQHGLDYHKLLKQL